MRSQAIELEKIEKIKQILLGGPHGPSHACEILHRRATYLLLLDCKGPLVDIVAWDKAILVVRVVLDKLLDVFLIVTLKVEDGALTLVVCATGLDESSLKLLLSIAEVLRTIRTTLLQNSLDVVVYAPYKVILVYTHRFVDTLP